MQLQACQNVDEQGRVSLEEASCKSPRMAPSPSAVQPPQGVPDRAGLKLLIEELQAGNHREENFRRIFDLYRQPIVGFFRNRGFSDDERRDLTQDTFLKAFRGITEFRFDASFDTWLFRIAKNLWCNAIRARGTLKRSGAEEALAFEPGSPAGSDSYLSVEQVLTTSSGGALEAILLDERERLLQRTLLELNPRERQIIFLHFHQGMKYREIASVLRMAEGTVKSRLSRAIQAVRHRLEGCYSAFGASEEEQL